MIDRSPTEPDSNAYVSGLSIITPPRLPAVWEKYQQGLLSPEQAEVEMGGPEEYKEPEDGMDLRRVTQVQSTPNLRAIDMKDPNSIRHRL